MPKLDEWRFHLQVQNPSEKLQRLCAKLHAVFPPAQVVHELLRQPPSVGWTEHLSIHQKNRSTNPGPRR